jgi:hypothetical protein
MLMLRQLIRPLGLLVWGGFGEYLVKCVQRRRMEHSVMRPSGRGNALLLYLDGLIGMLDSLVSLFSRDGTDSLLNLR